MCELKKLKHLPRRFLKTLMIKIVIELEMIVTMETNTEVLCILYAIYETKHLKNFLQFFTMDQTMIIILLKKRQQSLKNNLNV